MNRNLPANEGGPPGGGPGGIAPGGACEHPFENDLQYYYFFRQANFCKKTGAFLAKIRALDGRKDGQNSSYVLKKGA